LLVAWHRQVRDDVQVDDVVPVGLLPDPCARRLVISPRAAMNVWSNRGSFADLGWGRTLMPYQYGVTSARARSYRQVMLMWM
jgi:hypothetical protein